MGYHFYILPAFVLCVFLSAGQSKTVKEFKNLVYIDIGGIGGYGSVNYEKIIFHKNNFSTSARIGLSTYHLIDFSNNFNPDIIIPFSIYFHYGNKHKIEIGTGMSMASIIKKNPNTYKPERSFDLHYNYSIGYRFQKSSSHFFFRCALTPLLEFNNIFRYWGCISIGYIF